MYFKLNFWQTIALFFPIIAGITIMDLPHSSLSAYQTQFAIANLLFVINVFLVIIYQASLIFRFNVIAGIKSRTYMINAWIPVIFLTIYLLYAIFITIIHPFYHSLNYKPGPLKTSDFNIKEWILFLFLVHAFITFYFINNQSVAKKIKAIQDGSQREQLISEFLVPMKRLTKVSIWITVGCILVSVLVDLLTLRAFK